MVEVVVRIPKQDFDFIKDEFADGNMPDEKDLKETTYYAIANGTVLTKGHGRLIDADTYRKEMLDSREFDFFKKLDMQPTIIEADKEVDNERRKRESLL